MTFKDRLKSHLSPGVIERLKRIRDPLRGVQDKATLAVEFLSDMRRFARYHTSLTPLNKRNLTSRALEAQLTMEYHRVEKGFALPSPRQPFGIQVGKNIDHLLTLSGSAPAAIVEQAQDALRALENWNQVGVIDETIAPFHSRGNGFDIEYMRKFFTTRRSVRNFSDHLPGIDVIEQAVALAVNSPSVCNRAPWHVRCYQSPDTISKALSFQNGNRGFSAIPTLCVVTVDLRMFLGSIERNQGWIEGGIFSMTLVWALHALGLDTCMLNMDLPRRRMRSFRKAMDIPDHELVIMEIAVGYASERHRVARSARRNTKDVLIHVE